jgi:hypothetical protein
MTTTGLLETVFSAGSTPEVTSQVHKGYNHKGSVKKRISGHESQELDAKTN